jgi:Flp pilus assembly pilin Flp
MNHIRRQLTETQGQTMTEYAVILALIVTVTLAVIPTLGTSVLNLWNQVAGAVGGS